MWIATHGRACNILFLLLHLLLLSVAMKGFAFELHRFSSQVHRRVAGAKLVLELWSLTAQLKAAQQER